MKFDIHVHIEHSECVTRMLQQILTQQEQIMKDVSEIKQLVSDINTETNAVAAKIDAQQQRIEELSAQVAAGTPATQADLDEIVAGLAPISDRLKSLGADASAPIPPPV